MLDRFLIPRAPSLLVLLGAALAACGGNDLTVPPTTASIEVTTSTAGPEPDADGYTVQMDAEPAQAIQAAGTVQYTDITPGAHTVQLAGLAPNCAVAEQNPRPVHVAAGETARISFSVTCGATTGGLQVTAATSGDSPDADGYVLTVDGSERGVLTGAGGVSVAGLAPGDHLIGLSGVAANCVVQGENPRTVTLAAGQTPAVAFTVVCAVPPASTGTLRVVTSTTGPDQDTNGYSFAVDGGAGQPIALSASANVPNLAAGAHQVRLSGLAGNCTVQGDNPRSVTVSAGATAEASFAVTCTVINGSIRVAVTTSGSPTDPDGYTIKVDNRNPGQAVVTNGSATLPGISAGRHTVTLTGVASNCSVTDGASREVAVTAGGTAELSFTVTCSATTGTLKVSASTTGEPMDADGYSILVNGEAGGPLPSNGNVTLAGLAPGSYSVLLTGIADGCQVQGENPRSQVVTAGSTAEIGFTVTCAPPPTGQGSWRLGSPIPTVRLRMAGAVVQNGAGQDVLYAIGGLDPLTRGTLTRVEAYNAGTGSWEQRADLPAALSSATAAAIGGKIYLMGGTDGAGAPTKTLYVYDVAADSWVQKGDLPGVFFPGIAGVIGGQLYLVAASQSALDNPQQLYRYDPATDTWTHLTDPANSHTSGIGGVIDGKLYLAWGASYTVDVYDPSTGSWTARPAQPYGGIPQELCGVDATDCSVHGAAGAVLQGQLFVMGGRNDDESMLLVYAYDPVSNTWTRKADMGNAREGMPVAGTLKDAGGQPHIFVVSGFDENSGDPAVTDTEFFTP